MPATSNYAVTAIPVWWLFCFIPHLYSSTLLIAPGDIKLKDPDTKLNPGDNLYYYGNPRGKDAEAYYAKILDKRTFQKWERTRAAHNNLLESSPFIIGTMITGIVAKLPASFMNTAFILYLLTRVVYVLAYINLEKGAITASRTLLFATGNTIQCVILWRAGSKIMAGDY